MCAPLTSDFLAWLRTVLAIGSNRLTRNLGSLTDRRAVNTLGHAGLHNNASSPGSVAARDKNQFIPGGNCITRLVLQRSRRLCLEDHEVNQAMD